jgi:vesicle coat complex subunit
MHKTGAGMNAISVVSVFARAVLESIGDRTVMASSAAAVCLSKCIELKTFSGYYVAAEYMHGNDGRT